MYVSPSCSYRYGTSRLSLGWSALEIKVALRSLRRRLGLLASKRCCFHPLLRMSLPLAVTLRRLAAARFVLIFGMVSLSSLFPSPLRGEGRVRGPRVSGRSMQIPLVWLRRQDHGEHAPFHPRVALDDRRVGHDLRHLVQHLPSELGVGHLASLEAHGHLGLVALFKEAPHVLRLEVEVMSVRLGPELDFLDLDRRLLLP